METMVHVLCAMLRTTLTLGWVFLRIPFKNTGVVNNNTVRSSIRRFPDVAVCWYNVILRFSSVSVGVIQQSYIDVIPVHHLSPLACRLPCPV